jgi:hypothetical protein
MFRLRKAHILLVNYVPVFSAGHAVLQMKFSSKIRSLLSLKISVLKQLRYRDIKPLPL